MIKELEDDLNNISKQLSDSIDQSSVQELFGENELKGKIIKELNDQLNQSKLELSQLQNQSVDISNYNSLYLLNYFVEFTTLTNYTQIQKQRYKKFKF